LITFYVVLYLGNLVSIFLIGIYEYIFIFNNSQLFIPLITSIYQNKIKKTGLKVKLLLVILFFLLLPGLVQAQDLILNPSGSNDQKSISDAIKIVSESGGGNVYLNGGIYEIANTITMKSNVRLTGDSNAVLRVSASSQWFTGQIGVISNPDEALHNVEISGFQIDGNIKNLPRSWDSTPGHDRDCEKIILIGGFSSSMGSNISIHDMKIYDSFSDGIYIRFTEGVYLYNNFISDCQHEGFYLACCRGGKIYNNQIAGICSDNGRLDNCQNFLIKDNMFFSYSGDSYGAYEHGENSLQIGNQGGSSHGYTPTAKPFTTENIEVRNNTFISPGLQAFSLSGGDNVFIHNNIFKDAKELETLGISVGNYSYNNPPSVEQSERVFSSIFDILNHKFSTTAIIPQTKPIISFTNWQKKGINTEATLSIDGFRNLSKIDGIEYIRGSAQNNAIINYQTRNNAGLKARQTSELSYQKDNGTLTAILTVSTSWYSKSSKQVTILGKSVGIPSIDKKSETETFTTSAQAPQQFPNASDIKAEVTYYNNTYNPYALVSLDNAWGIVQENYQYNGSEASHFKLVGEVQSKSSGLEYVNYSKVSTWKTTDNRTTGYTNELRINGHFQKEKLKISVQTPYETINVSQVNVTEIGDESGLVLNPSLWAFIGTLSILGIWIYRNLKRMVFKF
jgi:hypothetical protein